MRKADRYDFTAHADEQREVMLAASKSLMTGRNAITSTVITLTLTILAGVGGMAIVAVITSWLDINATWWMLVGWLAGGGLYLLSFRLLHRELAKQSSQRPLHQVPQSLVFDETGVTYLAGSATWSTPWEIVDSVVETQRTITVVVAGIAFGLPKTAVGDKAECDRLIVDLQAQIDSRRNA